ncbi:S8 family serine peptidase [Roseibium sp.]|uniref:S8 family serine peptidase n=1 Tax=Roseibium sp. TaxID=1936156 RepID=UPI003A978C29
MKHNIYAAMLGAVLTASTLSALAQSRDIIWEKRVENASQAQAAQEDFLLTLFNTGRLPFREVPMGDHSTPEEVMRANGAWVGPMTEQIATLLCQLNQSRCDLAPSNSNKGKDVQSVAGVFAKPARWTIRPTDMITIPDVRIVQVSRPEPAERGATVEAFDFQIQRVCVYASLCFDDYITEPNEPLGRLRDIVVATRDSSRAPFPLQLVPYLAAAVNVPEEPIDHYQKLRLTSPTNHVFSDTAFQRFDQRLSKDIIGPIELQIETGHGANLFEKYAQEPLATHQKIILDSFCNVAVHGKCPDVEINSILPFVIGVIDQVPNMHCDFGDNIRVLDLDNLIIVDDANINSAQGPALDCDSDVRHANLVQRKHHGTHVLGLLAAKQNARGVGGLLGDVPNFSYVVIPFDETGDLQGNPTFTVHLADSIRRAVTEGVQIFNFSASYRLPDEAAKDPVLEVIESLAEHVLFVAAAGKHGVNAEKGTCPAKPACYARSLPNVIAVAGLEDALESVELLKQKDDPEIFLTNYGASTFAVGALARNIVSTIEKGAFGPMTGTSQAAPQVTAAAALLMQRSNLTPAKTRERLIYSSRLSTDAVELLQGGALDASAALLEKDWMQLDNGCVLSGDIRNFKRHVNNQWQDADIKLKILSNDAILARPIGDIRRVHWEKDQGIFFYANGDRVGRAHASFDDNPETYRIHFDIEEYSERCDGEFDASVHEIQLSRVVDFIASAK